MSSVTFFISLWSERRLSPEGSAESGTKFPDLSKKRFQSLRKKREQPSIPLLSHGLLWFIGPRNIS